MTIKIRKETVEDYCHIAKVNYLAFHHWKPDNHYVREGIMVDVLRQHSGFKPELSLVAEVDGDIVGHVLFLPFKVVVLGDLVEGMILGPVAVKPSYQKQGVGKALIEAGHKKAKELGIMISFCCGHDSYYPKFGYKTSMFSLGGVKVSQTSDGHDFIDYQVRNIEESDESFIESLWYSNHKEDALAICPGGSLSDWLNFNEKCNVKIVQKDNQDIGYIRYQLYNGFEVKELVAIEGQFVNLLSYAFHMAAEKNVSEIHLLMDEDKVKNLVGSKNDFSFKDNHLVYDAFMIKSLTENSVVDRYIQLVTNQQVKAGTIALTNVYDIEE